MDIVTYALCKGQIKKTLAGGGVSAGKPCQIKSIEDSADGKVVNFIWYLDDGTTQESTMIVPKGEKGDSPNIIIEEVDDGHKITFIDSIGEQSFIVKDGTGGSSEEFGSISLDEVISWF